jgi:hypothetical protein
MAWAVCRACRLVQDDAAICRGCAGTTLLPADRLHELADLELGLVAKQPPTGERDRFELLLTVMAMCAGGGLVGVIDPAWAIPAFIVPGFVGYWQQRRRLARARRGKIRAVALPAWPEGESYTGTAEPAGAPVAAPFSGTPALAATGAISTASGVHFQRRVACDFWILRDDAERVLITGEVDVATPAPPPDVLLEPARRTWSHAQIDHFVALGLRADLRFDRPVFANELSVTAGDRVEASGGEPRRELVAGLGYRDQEVLVLRGKAGAPVVVRTRG